MSFINILKKKLFEHHNKAKIYREQCLSKICANLILRLTQPNEHHPVSSDIQVFFNCLKNEIDVLYEMLYLRKPEGEANSITDVFSFVEDNISGEKSYFTSLIESKDKEITEIKGSIDHFKSNNDITKNSESEKFKLSKDMFITYFRSFPFHEYENISEKLKLDDFQENFITEKIITQKTSKKLSEEINKCIQIQLGLYNMFSNQNTIFYGNKDIKDIFDEFLKKHCILVLKSKPTAKGKLKFKNLNISEDSVNINSFGNLIEDFKGGVKVSEPEPPGPPAPPGPTIPPEPLGAPAPAPKPSGPTIPPAPLGAPAPLGTPALPEPTTTPVKLKIKKVKPNNKIMIINIMKDTYKKTKHVSFANDTNDTNNTNNTNNTTQNNNALSEVYKSSSLDLKKIAKSLDSSKKIEKAKTEKMFKDSLEKDLPNNNSSGPFSIKIYDYENKMNLKNILNKCIEKLNNNSSGNIKFLLDDDRIRFHLTSEYIIVTFFINYEQEIDLSKIKI